MKITVSCRPYWLWVVFFFSHLWTSFLSLYLFSVSCCINKHGAPPPPHCLPLVSSHPSAAPCPCQSSYLISPQGETHIGDCCSECKLKRVFICYSQGRSFLIILPQTDPHSSLHPCYFTFLHPFLSKSTFFQLQWWSWALTRPFSHSLSYLPLRFSFFLLLSPLPSSSGLGLRIVQSVDDGPYLSHSSKVDGSCSENGIHALCSAGPCYWMVVFIYMKIHNDNH